MTEATKCGELASVSMDARDPDWFRGSAGERNASLHQSATG
jgi:hypothetical protein